MTISVLQETQNSIGTSVANLALAFVSNITLGSSIHVICCGVDTATSFTCSDTLNGSYGVALDIIDIGPDTLRVAHFNFSNSATGANTVTITPNVSTTFVGIWIREIGGTSGLDKHAALANLAPGTGANAVTSGLATPTVQPGLVSALCTDSTTDVVPTIGSGFTTGIPGWTFGNVNSSQSESLRYLALTALAGTFTSASATDNFGVLAAFYKETAVSTAKIAWLI